MIRALLKAASLAVFATMVACSGSGTSDDYFTPGVTVTPPEIIASRDSRGDLSPMDAYSFGQVSDVTSTLITLQNLGDFAAVISNVSFGNSSFGFSGGSFPGSGGSCGMSIPHNSSCTIAVSFTPTVGQSFSANLSITYLSRSENKTLSVLLTGSGPSESGNGGVTYPPPVITAIDISGGALAGGITIQLTGTGFRTGATTTFDGSTCTSPTVSETQISCVVPAHSAGTVDIIVRNTDGQTGTLAGGYTYRAAPTVTSLSPNAGALAGGTSVVITGTGFISGASVTFGGSAATSVTVDSVTQITCTTPAHAAGAVDVVVTNTDNQSGTKSNGYTYRAAPTVTSLSPNAGALAGGTFVVITGTGFISGAGVTFGGSAATSVTVDSATQITCTTPAHAVGAVDVVVTNTDNQSGTKSGGYTYRAAPTVTSLSPNGGALAGGTSVVITGTGFVSGANVTFGGSAATSVTVDSATQITCTTPAHGAGAVDVVVTNTDNQSGTKSGGYTYRAAPTVALLSPNGGSLAGGTSVIITGTGFISGAGVTFGGDSALSVTVDSATQITCTTPAHAAGAVDVVVTNTDNQSGTKSNGYTFRPAPIVTSLSPSAGALAGGTSVTITGTGFVSGASVTFGGSAATSVTVDSATQITCTTPAHATGTVDVVVTNTDNQSGTKSNGYTYQAAPTVTSLSPNAGALAGGTSVVITGTGFISGAGVTFGGSAATSVTVDSATQITCTTPAHAAGAVDVVVTNTDTQSGTKSNGYTYQAAPTFTASTPAAGALAGGTNVTITGTGFLSGATVTYGGSACTSVSVVNATSITCTTPAHAAGAVNVVVTNTDNQSVTGTNAYTYQAAPTVASTSPNSGTSSGGTSIAISGTGFLSGATVTVGGAACTGVSIDSATQISCTTPAGTVGAVNVVVTNTDSQSGTGTGVYTYTAAPGVGSWAATSTSGAPAARALVTAVWTGSKMIVWGGRAGASQFNSGGQYDPIADSWSTVTTTGAPSERYYHTAIWTGSRMIIWGGRNDSDATGTGGKYDPLADSWTSTTNTGAPTARYAHNATWTGSKMIIWGGRTFVSPLNSGGQYDPAADSWTSTTTSSAPEARIGHTAIWTGSEMIVWGGSLTGGATNTGGKYNPFADSWTTLSTSGAPTARYDATAVWSGSKMIVWGGLSGTGRENTGGLYNPLTDAWTSTSTTGAPTARYMFPGIWTGSAMLIWAGYDNNGVAFNTGGLYSPNSDTWQTMTTTSAPLARYAFAAVWTGSSGNGANFSGNEGPLGKLIVWGGWGWDGNSNTNEQSGGVYTPPADAASDSWVATTTTGAPSARVNHSAVWTGSKMIIWGGSTGVPTDTGATYDPVNDSWTTTTTATAPTARHSHTAQWTGARMIVWGGTDNVGSQFNTGGRYDPISDRWLSITLTGAPAGKMGPKSVWTGSKMIVWGGGGNTGGQYDPESDSWTSTTTTNAPAARGDHSIIWTGSKMIVWGGYGSMQLNTGGIYDPTLDSWTATTTTGAPAARYAHVAVWTGSKMLIYGGNSTGFTDTGGAYDPSNDSWTEMTQTNAPEGRIYNCLPVWTGSKLLVWGGYTNSNSATNTGGLYDPIANTWTATSTTNAPAGRNQHTCTWTGSKMIVFGGTNGGQINTGGVYTP